MSGTEAQNIYIKANSKRNGIATLLVGLAGLTASAIWIASVPQWLVLAGIFLTSASIVAILVGWFKLREPDYSIELSPEAIRYCHRLGNWRIDWSNLQRFDCPRVRQGLDFNELDAIGFKLKDYAPFIQSVSPRLATHLLMEQRPLLLQNRDESCATGTCFGNEFLDDSRYVLENGEVLTGVRAMLANRMAQLRKQLGFDVFLSSVELDRAPGDFVQLLKDCEQSRPR
ncbi:DUF2982 domain-containing protein [Alteromonas aestuariivivens]|uniref:DUF2982 domain-containing protein n=1 Tax=Alteromonas aestuariivivens TaxID=1938339 RepID=A0A3D8M9U1_9ALTE|nr:DUF2982 domain-containing protein [Alteromonas aestuariivivens]RDV26721.1 DUF2982 domain-containing protein [Alteromonas aestuariivivens]